MSKKINLRKIITGSLIGLIVMGTNFGCKKIDETIDEAFKGLFEGVFNVGDDWQVELDGSSRATFITAGLTKIGITSGDPFMIGMVKTGDNKWRGNVRGNKGFGFLGSGNAEINGDRLIITPDGGSQYTINKGTKNIGGGTPIGSNAQTLVNQTISGKRGESKIIRFNLPVGVKEMEIRTTEAPGYTRDNFADMFVKRGSDPTVTLVPKYSWTADCFGVESNTADEVCKFTNPPSGQWSVLLYGYNSDFISQLTVKITK